MRYQELNPEKLAQFAENVRTLLEGTELSAINPVMRAELLTKIGSLPEILVEQDKAYFVNTGLTKASLSERNSTSGVLDDVMRSVHGQLISVNAPIEQFELCKFLYPAKKRVRVVANIPSDLAVEGFSNQINKGRFVGNNKTGTITYEVFRREGDSGEWLLRLQTRKQSFTDVDVTPGQPYVYKVRAVAARNASGFSNETLVYGV